MLGDGSCELVAIAPGAQTVVAQTNSNFQQVNAVASGLRFTLIAGESLFVGDLVALESADGHVYKADSDGSNNRFNCLGVSLKSVLAGAEVIVMLRGVLDFSHVYQPGAPLFLSTTPGVMTTSGSRVVGIALPDNQILVDPSSSWSVT